MSTKLQEKSVVLCKQNVSDLINTALSESYMQLVNKTFCQRFKAKGGKK